MLRGQNQTAVCLSKSVSSTLLIYSTLTLLFDLNYQIEACRVASKLLFGHKVVLTFQLLSDPQLL